VGYVEASHGCVHRCRHCPVPPVYDGRIRIVGADTVVQDIAGLVELGWNKALDAVEHRDPAIRAREVDDLAWWVHEARTTLDAGLLP